MIIQYIRSIEKNFLELESRINLLKNKLDIIFCTEAWLTDKVNFIDMKGYNHFFNDSKMNKSDGTGFYIKNWLKYEVTSENCNKRCTTGVIIIIELTNKFTIKVTGVCRCHDFEIDAFINDLKKLVKTNSIYSKIMK